MSTPRRLFEDPRNTYMVGNDDPAAFDKRFVNRPGVHREQQCCGNRAPVWQSYLIRDGDDPGDGNRTAYKKGDPLQVDDATGESDQTSGRNQTKGYVWVEGPNSGYRPDFVSPEEWMHWQSVYWMPSPRAVAGLPNPPRWVRIPGERKVRWGDWGGWELLWCQKCETPLEATWADVLEGLPIAARGIAMVASYVPVFGTAISLVINTSVSLAQGERIDQSLLDGIGGALPEQPASGMAFNAAVAIAKGERLDQVAIDALPIDRSVRDVLKVADEIVFGIASGQSITDVAYNTIRNRLPPDARQGLDLARRVANGENIPQMVLTEAEQMVVNGVKDRARAIIDEARSQGADAISAAQIEVDRIFNQYAVECGYQMALDRLPDDARGWVQLGLVGGAALKDSMPFVGTFGSVAESNAVENDSYETKGRKLIAAGIRYRNRLVSDILSASTFSVVIDFYDSLNGVWTKRSMSYENTAAWRRGFVIAIGVCEGSSQRGPGQLAVYQTLAEAGGRAGFDAGQAVQYNRTLGGDSGLMVTGVKVEDGSHFIQKIVPNFVNLSPDTATALAKREGVAVEFVHAQSENDIFGADLQMLSSGDGVNRAHPDAEIVVNVQRPLPGATLDPGTSVSLGVALAPGVEP